MVTFFSVEQTTNLKDSSNNCQNIPGWEGWGVSSNHSMAEFAALYEKRGSLTTSCQIGHQHGFPQTRHSAPDKTFRCCAECSVAPRLLSRAFSLLCTQVSMLLAKRAFCRVCYCCPRCCCCCCCCCSSSSSSSQ